MSGRKIEFWQSCSEEMPAPIKRQRTKGPWYRVYTVAKVELKNAVKATSFVDAARKALALTSDMRERLEDRASSDAVDLCEHNREFTVFRCDPEMGQDGDPVGDPLCFEEDKDEDGNTFICATRVE